jgi:hypothetical protein
LLDRSVKGIEINMHDHPLHATILPACNSCVTSGYMPCRAGMALL